METHQGVGGFEGAQAISDEEFWNVEMDILIPAALESQITVERAQKLTAKLVLEGANGPTFLKRTMYWFNVVLRLCLTSSVMRVV
jgi:glutamate dehydrogenase (NAD(P)+)